MLFSPNCFTDSQLPLSDLKFRANYSKCFCTFCTREKLRILGYYLSPGCARREGRRFGTQGARMTDLQNFKWENLSCQR